MSTPQRTRLTNNQKLTLIEESQKPGFKIEDAKAKYSLSQAAVYRIIQNKRQNCFKSSYKLGEIIEEQ